jgi:hypothetical protein
MGIDPGYGSSAFGVVVTQWVDNHIQILHAEEYHRPDYNEMLSVVYGLMSKYNVDKVYIDGANPSFIRSLKLQIGEDAIIWNRFLALNQLVGQKSKHLRT